MQNGKWAKADIDSKPTNQFIRYNRPGKWVRIRIWCIRSHRPIIYDSVKARTRWSLRKNEKKTTAIINFPNEFQIFVETRAELEWCRARFNHRGCNIFRRQKLIKKRLNLGNGAACECVLLIKLPAIHSFSSAVWSRPNQAARQHIWLKTISHTHRSQPKIFLAFVSAHSIRASVRITNLSISRCLSLGNISEWWFSSVVCLLRPATGTYKRARTPSNYSVVLISHYTIEMSEKNRKKKKQFRTSNPILWKLHYTLTLVRRFSLTHKPTLSRYLE